MIFFHFYCPSHGSTVQDCFFGNRAGIIGGPMAKSQNLLVRLLNTPDLARVVPQLPAEVLHRVIQTCGLEDCAEFVALATPGQLARLLDLDIWRLRTPGGDEEFDADRFGLWLAVLMQSGPAVTAEKLMGLEVDLVIAGFARHVSVFDHAAVSSYTTLDGEHVPGRAVNRNLVSEIGGYVIAARRAAAWEPIVDLLAFLDAEHAGYFHRVMRGCVRLSNGLREQDGLHDLLEDDEQDLFDLGCDREARREQQGYVTPAQAHAFLRAAQDVQLDAARPPRSVNAEAYFRTLEPARTLQTDAAREAGRIPPESSRVASSDLEPDRVAVVVELLREAGVVAPQPQALLVSQDSQASDLPLIQAHVASHPASAGELAYLANTIMAGCVIQGRPFTPREASAGTAAICNLGLENWPSHWPDADLVTAFQVGWAILHRDVSMYSAKRLADVLGNIRCQDRDIDLRLGALRRELIQHVRNREPWRARDALDVILMLDAVSWAVLLALIDECPVIHAALGASQRRCLTVDPTAFEFISANAQIAVIRGFMTSLPSALAG
jgi:hypothetical protein